MGTDLAHKEFVESVKSVLEKIQGRRFRARDILKWFAMCVFVGFLSKGGGESMDEPNPRAV